MSTEVFVVVSRIHIGVTLGIFTNKGVAAAYARANEGMVTPRLLRSEIPKPNEINNGWAR